MNITTVLICIDWFYPAFKAGGPVLSIKNLVDTFTENVSYRILCSDRDLGNEKLYNQTDCWTDYNERVKVWYCSRNKRSLKLFKKLNNEVKPDIIFINGLYSPFYNFIPMAFGHARKIILSARGMLNPGSLGEKSFKKSIYFRILKLLGIHHKVIFHATNQIERDFIIEKMGKGVNVQIAENFPRKIKPASNVAKEVNTLKLVTIALISPTKNYSKVLTALAGSQNQIEYNIYGPVKEMDYWLSCLSIIKELPPNITVNYKGVITPDRVPETLAEHDVYIQPSKSENFGHSIYEALSAGKPVITSNTTPWNNLRSASAGINVNPENVADLLNAIDFFAFLGEEDLKKWNKSAIDYSDNAIDIENIIDQYKILFKS